MKTTAAITAVGAYLPDDILTNQDLEKMVDTTNDWILERTGIQERHILKGPYGTSTLAARAIQSLLQQRNLSPLDIDLIIVATTTPDMMFPATANVVGDMIGAKNAWGFDLQAACSGFIYALSTGAQFIETGRYKKVVVVGADKMSSIIDYEDRNTCIIFGDGGGAVLLEPNYEGLGVLDFILHSDGAGREFLHMKAGGSMKPASLETVRNKEHYVYQEGKTVFKFAVTNMADVAVKIMEKNNLGPDDIAWLVPHQANKRIIDSTGQRMGIPPEKVIVNIQKYGNTTSGTIPICLFEWKDKFKKGDNLILASFGGGFTWGAVYVKWGC
ncbi:MAG: ketoacyl-ACP synthase III [Sphingobacteriia bacterium]|nr:ketoacyl-ACP synthase III [Sphingobacteriia bacterium]